jgi:hypothetical protein
MNIMWVIVGVGATITAYGFAKSPMLFMVAAIVTALTITFVSELSPQQYSEVIALATLDDAVADTVKKSRNSDGVLRYYNYLVIEEEAKHVMRNARD